MPDPHALLPELRAALDREFARAVASYNHLPQAVLGGLSPAQAGELLASDWTTGAFRVDSGVTLDDLVASDVLVNARTLLEMLRDEGPAPATSDGNLARRFVERTIDRLVWPDDLIESLRRTTKVVDEADLFPLYELRETLQAARLVRRHSGFRITERGRALLAPERAGELFQALVVTFFRTLDLARLDSMAPTPGLRHTLPLALYRLRTEARDWVRPEALPARIWTPEVFPPPDPAVPHSADEPFHLTESRLVFPLVDFGLLDRRYLGEGPRYALDYEVRVSRLFGRAFRFGLER
jgi:hypothetical protein